MAEFKETVIDYIIEAEMKKISGRDKKAYVISMLEQFGWVKTESERALCSEMIDIIILAHNKKLFQKITSGELYRAWKRSECCNLC